MGAPIGIRLPKHKIQDYFLDRMCKHISSWKAKHLSFTARVILIKQVLMAIPVYHQIYIHFPKGPLQQLYKDFL